ncbi:MAG: dTDP-4-dehydrorhamnose reductase, partial [Gammaproteobacteria bacterium]|nr:dTDP-4-dehydrorhamnose reductase [Gammaproteobacteria bacterium]
AVTLHSFHRCELDITNERELEERLSGLDVDVLINAAAYTQVEKAEQEKDLAFKVNWNGAQLAAQWACNNKCRFIHVSTDFVFDGKSNKSYCPDDATAPVNVYGASKLAGEQAVLQAHPQGAIIVRTGWLYSCHRSNFVTAMLELMSQRDHLGIVVDQLGTPTSAHSLADLIAQVVAGETQSGVFHWSDAGVASWYDFAVAIQEEAIAAGLLDRTIPIEPISSEQYPTAAARPASSLLDKSTSYTAFGTAPIHWRKQLRVVIKELAINN